MQRRTTIPRAEVPGIVRVVLPPQRVGQTCPLLSSKEYQLPARVLLPSVGRSFLLRSEWVCGVSRLVGNCSKYPVRSVVNNVFADHI